MTIKYLIADEIYIYEMYDESGKYPHPPIEVTDDFQKRYDAAMNEFWEVQREIRNLLMEDMRKQKAAKNEISNI